MITGFTSHKLDLIRTYDNNNPFQIGVNGVTNIEYSDIINQTGITKIYYTIGDIDYETDYRDLPTTKTTFNPYGSKYPTKFKTSAFGEDFNEYFLIKEESKMGLVSPPKVTNELFIERMNVAVFERHSRLSEIKTLEGLINYRNNYYNIIENR